MGINWHKCPVKQQIGNVHYLDTQFSVRQKKSHANI